MEGFKSAESRLLRLFQKSREQWKQRAAEKQKKLRAMEVKVRDLSASREHWKERLQKSVITSQVLFFVNCLGNQSSMLYQDLTRYVGITLGVTKRRNKGRTSLDNITFGYDRQTRSLRCRPCRRFPPAGTRHLREVLPLSRFLSGKTANSLQKKTPQQL